MKTKQEIDEILQKVDNHSGTKYPGMTYEDGVVEALLWVLGQLPDEEFSPAQE